MRSPSSSDAQENPVGPIDTVGRDPSYPDRARLDSDVRAFLRPASSPWIVFDRDSRIDDFAKSALRVGAVFASRPATLEIMHDRIASAAMFPKTETIATPVAEPSTVVVAADIVQPAPTTRPRSTYTIPDGLVRKGNGRIGILFAAIGVVLGVTTLVSLRPAKHDSPAAAAAPMGAAPSVVTAEVVPAPAPVVTAEAAPVVEVTKPAADGDPKTKRLGKLTIKADPKTKNVWFDGKRMLGTGQRTFLVACGMHTIAVNDKKDARDVEVPCNGEYAIGK